ncbi:hypothetical protein NP493_10g07026 [Ridgeia piscesae]|uniref:Uncharacterized protein n=1 Tax=Ridgeia piscesae TaxID=27915 RepID=A0AAD9PFG0_RIDPI|nr:hypothetical protein NP493_10g07026 [Ridgeia piscesae]
MNMPTGTGRLIPAAYARSGPMYPSWSWRTKLSGLNRGALNVLLRSYALPGISTSRASNMVMLMKRPPGLEALTSLRGLLNWIMLSLRCVRGPSTNTFCSL